MRNSNELKQNNLFTDLSCKFLSNKSCGCLYSITIFIQSKTFDMTVGSNTLRFGRAFNFFDFHFRIFSSCDFTDTKRTCKFRDVIMATTSAVKRSQITTLFYDNTFSNYLILLPTLLLRLFLYIQYKIKTQLYFCNYLFL